MESDTSQSNSLELAFRALEEGSDLPQSAPDLVREYLRYFEVHAPPVRLQGQGASFALFSLVDPTIRVYATDSASSGKQGE